MRKRYLEYDRNDEKLLSGKRNFVSLFVARQYLKSDEFHCPLGGACNKLIVTLAEG